MKAVEQGSPIFDLLGAEHMERLREGLAKVLIERVQDDFESWDNYVFYPPDYNEFMDEIFEECKQEIKEIVKKKMLAEAMKRLDGYVEMKL